MPEGERVNIDIERLTSGRISCSGQNITTGNKDIDVSALEPRKGTASKFTHEPRMGRILSEEMEMKSDPGSETLNEAL